MTARRVIRAERPGRLSMSSVPLGRPEPGQVLVESWFSCLSPGTERTALCGGFERGTHWDRWVRYPFGLGYSTVGRVTDTHPRSGGRATVGDWVCVHRPHTDRQWVDAADAVPAGTEHAPPPAAGLFALGALAHGAVRETGALLGEHVVVAGAGPVGQLCTALSRLAGAREVTMLARTAARDELCRRSGATAVVHSEDDLLDRVPGGGAGVAVDATGSGDVIPGLSRAVRRRGTILLVGDTPHPSRQGTGGELLRKGIVLRPFHDSMLVRAPDPPDRWWTHSRTVRDYVDLVSTGVLRLDHLITHRFPADGWRDAYDVILGDEPHCAVLLDWSAGDA